MSATGTGVYRSRDANDSRNERPTVLRLWPCHPAISAGISVAAFTSAFAVTFLPLDTLTRGSNSTLQWLGCLVVWTVVMVVLVPLGWRNTLRFATLKLYPAARVARLWTPGPIAQRELTTIPFEELAGSSVEVRAGDLTLNYLPKKRWRGVVNITQRCTRFASQEHRLPILAERLKAFLEPWEAEFDRVKGQVLEAERKRRSDDRKATAANTITGARAEGHGSVSPLDSGDESTSEGSSRRHTSG